jgi:riboflavin biosynthesis pyrimidine reductase
MRQVLPEAGEVDPYAVHAALDRPPPPGRPWVLLCVVASADGASAVGGVSGTLGGSGDQEVFFALRAVADVILVGATTVVAEQYRAPRTPAPRQADRQARGQAAGPRIAVVSGSLHLPVDLPMFGDPEQRPLVLTTTDADPSRRRDLEAVADVVAIGTGRVDLAAALHHLAGEGVRLVSCEGGSRLNGQLVAADLVDELDLTVAASLVAGSSPRVVAGPDEVLLGMRLDHLWERDGNLFARYLRA